MGCVRSAFVGLAGVLSVLSAPSASGQCENKQLAKLSGAPGVSFGGVTCLDGDWALVQGHGNGVTSYKSPEVWRRQSDGTWTFGVALVGDASGFNDQFGYAMHQGGGRIAVGAPTALGPNGVMRGAVYVFAPSGQSWSLESKLTPAVSSSVQVLGDRVATDGQALLAYRAVNSVDIFERTGTTWLFKQSLSPLFPFPSSGFGARLSIDGPIAVISAASESPSAFGSGAVYVFERDDLGVWSQSAKIIPNSTFYYGSFGTTVSVFENRILVGANGAAFVFEKIAGFWAQTAVLTTALTGFGFGARVSLGANVAVVSAPELPVQGGQNNSGAAFVFQLESGSWVERMMLTANDPMAQVQLGQSVDVSGTEAILGSPFSGSGSGSAYIFSLIPNPISQYGNGCPGSAGLTPSLSMKQTYDGCKHAGESVTLDFNKGLGGSSVLLLLGAQSGASLIPGGCTLLLVPSMVNATLPLFGNGPGNGSISVSASIPANFPSVSIFMQGFVFDPGVPHGYCATNGLRLSVY